MVKRQLKDPIYFPEKGVRGKLCNDPRIDNANLYWHFYVWGGYRIAQIARMFGKNYYVVRESIHRKLFPEDNTVRWSRKNLNDHNQCRSSVEQPKQEHGRYNHDVSTEVSPNYSFRTYDAQSVFKECCIKQGNSSTKTNRGGRARSCRTVALVQKSTGNAGKGIYG